MTFIAVYFLIGFLFALLMRIKAKCELPLEFWFWAIVVWPLFIIEMGGDFKI
jgi:hypothetical protein